LIDLKGKNILVTGGSRGIGAGIAQTLAALGAQVALTYSSNEASARKVLESLPGAGHSIARMELGDESSIEATGEKVLAEFGGQIHGVVNNAGITNDQLLLRMKTEDFDRVITTNLRGSFLVTRYFLKAMMKARQGSVVHLTSIIGQTGNAGQANYAASKAGLEAFSKSFALEMASRNIRSNCVAPGFIATEMTDVLSAEQKEKITEKIPLRFIGSTADVASAVAFLLSDSARYITGQTLNVNGGLYMN
jgi:3-oxoacyl-[acyl-carrier protein] reductase